MNYQSGRMGITEGLALAFVITFPPIFLSIPAKSVQAAGTAGWMPGAAGSVIAIAMLYLYSRVLDQHPGDLINAFRQLLGAPAAWIAGIYYFAVLFGLAILWTRQFAENTLLTALPFASFDVVILWYGLGSGLMVYAGVEALCRATYVILPIGIAGLLLVFALLYPMFKPMYLLPWQGMGLASVVRPTLNLLGASVPLVLLFILAPAFQTISTVRQAAFIGYGCSAFIRVLAVVIYIMVFGATVGSEKILPFYEMARLIYLNRYIQRLEAIFILLWVITGLLAIAFCLYGSLYIIAKLFKLPTIRPLLPAASLLAMQLAMLPANTDAVLRLESQFFGWFCTPGAILLPLLLWAASLWKGRQKACTNQSIS